MKFSLFERGIIFRTILVFLSLTGAALALVHKWYFFELILVPILIVQFVDYYRFQKKMQTELHQFMESVHYRDFSRHFETDKAPKELESFRKSFNEINSTFKKISKEKETQYLHLKTILDIVDTGIISFENNNGEVLWMNEAFKNLLNIPYLKSIHALEKRNKLLYTALMNIKSGTSQVIDINEQKNVFKIQMSARSFKNEEKEYKLIALHNIGDALEETESKAWHRLLSVMTHEIMNSVAPIASLAETLEKNILEAQQLPNMNKDNLADFETGIQTIKKRSEGLLNFTSVYRNLSNITQANLNPLRVSELFMHVQNLLQPSIDTKKIDFQVIMREPGITIQADSGLMEQVLINLVVNAIDAVKNCAIPKIVLKAEKLSGGKINILVTDNGCGIPTELHDKIFIPFFSTKKTGSGIGLSLCKQIILLHKGNIQIHSQQGKGTSVSVFL